MIAFSGGDLYTEIDEVLALFNPEDIEVTTFSDVVDAADSLSVDEQETLINILRRRIAKRNRESLIREIADARAEFQNGGTRVATAADIMNEVRGAS